MKKITKYIAVLCLLAVVLATVSGCRNGGETSDVSDDTSKTQDISTSPDGKTDYTVSLKSIGGVPLTDVTVFVYENETLEDLAGYGVTDENGVAKINLAVSNSYRVVVSDAPDGYVVDDSYPFNGVTAEIVLTSKVISDTDLSDVSYKLGDVMHDFTVTDPDGNSYTLSKLLEEKDMVMLNFWYTTCTYCIEEFPYMESAYNQYKDDIEIVAMNHYTSDSEKMVSDFKESYGLSFPMVKEDLGMVSAFALEGYPTSVFVDRYGVICLIEVGGIISEAPFINAFKHFTDDNYTQTLYSNISELVPVQKPNIEMPSADAIADTLSKGNTNITYHGETDENEAELTWPFVIGEKDGKACIYASNKDVHSSYATIYMNVKLKKGEALGFDYYSSSEASTDIMYVLVDRQDIYQISGQDDKWSACYPYVAIEDGEYEVALCYMKDTADSAGDDTVYISNVRIVDQSKIDVHSYIPRDCATNLKEDGFGYENYVSVVLNKKDGYYHVGTENGPLLLADLLNATKFSNTSINMLGIEGKLTLDGTDLYEELVDYCSFASNSQLFGLCTVNEELKELLVKTAKAVGIEQTDNEWLQICSYYDVYGDGAEQLSDPIKGLCADSAYTAKLGKDNVVTYNRVIMPRGLWYKFVPNVSGVYRITSDSDQDMDGWIFLEDGTEFYVYEHSERLYGDLSNVSMVVYLEAGKEYFIDIAYWDIYATGTFTFEIKYEASSMEIFRLASPGYFTYIEGDENATISGGIDIVLGNDGYYHEKLANGSLGSIIYADFIGQNNIFPTSLEKLLETDSFNFSISDNDQWLLDFKEENGEDYLEDLKEYWGDLYDENYEVYNVDDFIDGEFSGDGEDMTATAKKYADMAYKTGKSELIGCVPVNEELGDILQQLMDKFTFEGVENSWGKLCYYYDFLGADANR